MDDLERKAKKAAANKKFWASEAGERRRQKVRDDPDLRAARARYQKKYQESEKGREAFARYQAKYFDTEGGRSRLLYWNSPQAKGRKLPPWLKRIYDGRVVPVTWPEPPVGK